MSLSHFCPLTALSWAENVHVLTLVKVVQITVLHGTSECS